MRVASSHCGPRVQSQFAGRRRILNRGGIFFVFFPKWSVCEALGCGEALFGGVSSGAYPGQGPVICCCELGHAAAAGAGTVRERKGGSLSTAGAGRAGKSEGMWFRCGRKGRALGKGVEGQEVGELARDGVDACRKTGGTRPEE